MDVEDYDWLRRFYAEYLPDLGQWEEPKSDRVLRVIDTNNFARDQLFQNLAHATIIIIDLAEFVRQIVREIASAVDLDLRLFPDPVDAVLHLETTPVLQSLARAILSLARAEAIEGTMLGRIEAIVMDAARDFLPIRQPRLFDREALAELGDQAFRVLAARFAATLGDALRPEQLERIVEEHLRASRYLPADRYIAIESVELQLERDHTFDEGAQQALTELEAGRQRLATLLNEGPWREFQRPVRAGAVTEDDSRRLLGLQAADVAAAVARRIFEDLNGDTQARARAIRAVFDRVLLNDTWL